MPKTTEPGRDRRPDSSTGRLGSGSLAATLAEASNPASPPTRLHRLARHRSVAVREAVAANPNTGRADLVSLALVMPDTVAANSVLKWWLLEDANWLASIDERARHRLLAATSMSEGTRWWAARFGTSEDKSALLMCEHTNLDVLEYVGDTDGEFEELIRDHVTLSPTSQLDSARPVADALMNLLVVDADEARDVLAHACPAGWVLAQLDLSSTDLRRAVAAHAAATPSLLARLLLDDDERTVRFAERNPRASEPIGVLGISPLELAQRVRADDSSLRVEQLREVRDSPEGLRCLASHPSTTSDMIADLCTDASWVVRQVGAGSSRLTPEQLERLAIDDDRDVRAAAARNPALPIAILRSLQHDRDGFVRTEADEAALIRSSEDVIPLSSDDLELRIRTGRASIAAVYPDLPVSVQMGLAESQDWRVRHRLAANPTASPNVLHKLVRDEDVDVRKEVAQNPRSSVKSRRLLCSDESPEVRAISVALTDDPKVLDAAANDDDADVRRKVAANGAASVEALRSLASDTSAEVRTEIARREALPDDIVMRLAADAVDDVRAEVIRRPAVGAAVLEIAFSRFTGASDDGETADPSPPVETYRLSPAECRKTFHELAAPNRPAASAGTVDPERVERLLESVPWIVKVIADLPAVDAATQKLLARSTDWRVRECLARRSDLHIDVFRTLTKDSDYDTRAAIAANPNTPEDCLSLLARDGHKDTRMNVVDRPVISDEILDILALDDDEEIRELAGQKSHYRPAVADFLAALANEEDVDAHAVENLMEFSFVRKLAASHPGTTPEQLQRLATDQMWEIRELVAAHPRTLGETLESLAIDNDRDVRRGVAANPNTPPTIVATLLLDADRSVARAASSNVSRVRPEDIAHRALLKALRSKSVATRILALSCANVPERELGRRRHYMSIDWRERFAVAVHPKTSPAIRRALGSDGLHTVRNATRRSEP